MALFAADLEQVRVERADNGSFAKTAGLAVVYEARSIDLGGWREVIEVGAFDESIRKDDIRHLQDHISWRILGRTKSGTLRLSSDARGIAFENDLPPTSYAQDLAAVMERGDVNQCSFAYYTIDARWDMEARVPLRRVSKGQLQDTSIVTFPAYPQSRSKLRAAYGDWESDLEAVEDSLARLTELLTREQKVMPEAVHRALLARTAALAEAAKVLQIRAIPPEVPAWSAEAAERREAQLRDVEAILGRTEG